jgi:hypothetical protein
MVSSAQRTQSRRHNRDMRKGRAARRARFKANAPAFPVHPDGYDPKAPDAKRS